MKPCASPSDTFCLFLVFPGLGKIKVLQTLTTSAASSIAATFIGKMPAS